MTATTAIHDLLKLDAPSNYETADDAIEGIISEVEMTAELTTDEADAIAEAVEEWWNKGD